jgi:hypothetical protein
MGNPPARKPRKASKRHAWTGPKDSVVIKGDGRRLNQAKRTPTAADAAAIARVEVAKLLRSRTALKAAVLLIEQFVKHPAQPGMRRLEVARFQANKLVPRHFTPTEQEQVPAITTGFITAVQQLALAGDKLNGRQPQQRRPRTT